MHELNGSIYRIPLSATAIILAGGNSSRMEKEKSLLPVQGYPLIEYIYHQIKPGFKEVIISANNREKYAFLGLPVVRDRIPGCGPLMGIASAMEVSGNTLNFVTACDIPEINLKFVLNMLELCENHDAVIPISSEDFYEPLFAVYNKSMLPAMQNFLNEGGRKIRILFKEFNILYLPIENRQWLMNLNTIEDYRTYLETKKKPEISPG